MKDPIKILFISQTIKPYSPETALSDICREFPQYIQEQGSEIRTFMPCYGYINERRNQLHEVQRLSGMNIIIDETDHPLIIKVASIQSARMQVYFIDNDDYFKRKGEVADSNGIEYADNDQRSVFFARGVLETIKKLRWTPDVILCTGWITSLVPLFIKKAYCDDPFFAHSKVIYSVCDDEFSTEFKSGFEKLMDFKGIKSSDLIKVTQTPVSFEKLTELAVDYSDAIIFAGATINKNVERYIQQKQLPVLPYNKEYKEAYKAFIDKVASSESEF